MKYSIAIFPAKKLQDLANSYRKRYDPNYALIPPHIKLKDPFEATDEEIKDITKELHEVSNKAKRFSLNVYKVKSFNPINSVIYLAIKQTDEIMELHEMLHNEKLGQEKKYAFVPHITIGQRLSDQEQSDVMGRMSMMDINHSEPVDRFHLMYELENGAWTVYETFHLGEEC